MSLFGFTKAFARLFSKAIDATEPAKPVDWDASVVEEGKYIYAEIRIGGFVMRERIPRQIHKWPPARQEAHLEEVKNRLLKKSRIATKA